MLGTPASALTTITLAGAVQSFSAPPDSYYAGVAVGAPVRVAITFDEAAVDSFTEDPRFGAFRSNDPAAGISGTVGSLPFATGVAFPTVGFSWSTSTVFPNQQLRFEARGLPWLGGPPYATPPAAGDGDYTALWTVSVGYAGSFVPDDSMASALRVALGPGRVFAFRFHAADDAEPGSFREVFAARLVLVPEPSTATMIVLGLAGMGLAPTRRNRSQASC